MTSPPYTTVSLAKRWGCLFGHKWTTWGERFEEGYTLIDTWRGKPVGNGVHVRQARKCLVCGKRQERTIK